MSEPATPRETPSFSVQAPPSPSVSVSATPPPLGPNGRPRLGPRRQSRFTEEMVDHRTPAASISERSLDYYWFGRSAEDVNSNHGGGGAATPTITARAGSLLAPPSRADTPKTRNVSAEIESLPRWETEDSTVCKRGGWDRRTLLRMANVSLHFIPAMVVVVFFAFAMPALFEDDEGCRRRVQGTLVMSFAGLDSCLDTYILSRTRTRWPIWGLAIRLVFGIAYFALFFTYLGLGKPFPQGQTYWNLSADGAAIFIYVFLVLLGLWNSVHLPIGLLTKLFLRNSSSSNNKPTTSPSTPSLQTHDQRRTSFPDPHPRRFSTAGSSSIISLTWRRWVSRTQSSTHLAAAAGAGGDASVGSSRVDLEQGRHDSIGLDAAPPTIREPSATMDDSATIREEKKTIIPRKDHRVDYDDDDTSDDDEEEESSSPRSSSSPGGGSSRVGSSHGQEEGGKLRPRPLALGEKEGEGKKWGLRRSKDGKGDEEEVCPAPLSPFGVGMVGKGKEEM